MADSPHHTVPHRTTPFLTTPHHTSRLYQGAVQHDCVMCTQDMLQFGLKDLTIQSDRVEGHEAGMTCTSQLEFSYGVGLKIDSVDTKTFLGGAPTFPIDDIEIWAVQ